MTETSSPGAQTDIAIPGVEPSYRGKVRDIYDLGDQLLIVASDRISAYDSILPTGIPGKGKVLTQMSDFWFRTLAHLAQHHLVSTDVSEFPPPFKGHPELLAERSMLVHKTRRIDFECVVRGYLAGSGWREYRANGRVCGIPLPAGLEESAELPEPIFTPATKADSGHDENVSFEFMAEHVGEDRAEQLRERSLALYDAARAHARERGILIADTKLEFGVRDGAIVLIDEIFTPDSSRFWPADAYQPGRPQTAFDKQFVRDYLDSIGWDHAPPAPPLPPEVARRTAERYEEALRRLTTEAC